MYEGLKQLEVPLRQRRPRKRRRWLRRTLAIVLVILIGLIGTYGYTYLRVKHNIDKSAKEIQNLTAEAPKGPLNILVLGSDRRDVVEQGERTERQFRGGSGQRADTIILVHLYAGSNKAVLISIPRDLRVDIPGHGLNKINAAYPFGGPNLVVQTVHNLTGLPINHYVEVNFSSFRGIVNALGGVDLYFPKPVQDRRSGLNITKTGCLTLNGDQALSFVRARYIYPNADFGRIQAQQRFIRAVLDKTKSLGTLLNPAKLIAISNQVAKGVVHDKGLGLGLARAVAIKLGNAGQRGVDFRIFPGQGQTIGGISYVIPDRIAARRLFDALQAGTPLPAVGKTGQSLPDPADVNIRIVNATGVGGLASNERAALLKLGFRVASIGTGVRRSSVTTITYQVGGQLKAELVAKQFPGAIVKLGGADQQTDIVVTLGVNFVHPSGSPTATAKAKEAKPTTISACP